MMVSAIQSDAQRKSRKWKRWGGKHTIPHKWEPYRAICQVCGLTQEEVVVE